MTKVVYTALTGGLDGTNSPILTDGGRLRDCSNWEEVFGVRGYRRIYGYERFDGQAAPSSAPYCTLRFKSMAAEIVPGNVVAGAAASGIVLNVVVESGNVPAGNAAGYLVMWRVAGAFIDSEALKVAAATKALADGVQMLGSPGDLHYRASRALATDAARAAITPIPGGGPIRGGALYNGDVYAVRDSADGLTATLYKSSASGWAAVKTGLIAGGKWRFDVANFSGTATSKSLFGVDGRNTPFWFDGTNYTPITGIWDSTATSATSAAIGTGAATLVVAESNRDYAVGEALTVWDAANAANWMAGTVTTWTPGTKTLVLDITSTGGSGTKTAWEVGRTDFTDKPYVVRAHKDHLFLGFQNGQLQTSNLGDPLAYTTTATLFGVGDEITNLLTLRSDNLAVYCNNTISLISGSNQLDYTTDKYSTNGGARADTALEIVGVGVHIDSMAVKSLQATQAYGNYETSSFSANVGDIMQRINASLVGCLGQRVNQQYRAYATDGEVLVLTVTTPNAAITPKDVSASSCNYAHRIDCVFSGELADGNEALFFGTQEGYVMHEGVGTSFDGEPIFSSMRLPFNSFKAPSNKKRFLKIEAEVSASESVTINFKQHFDNQDGFYPSSKNLYASAEVDAGVWDVSAWDEFTWATLSQSTNTQHVRIPANVSGIGRSMSLTLWHSSVDALPFTLHGFLFHYKPLGLTR